MVYLYHQDNAWSSVSFLVSFWFWFSGACVPSALRARPGFLKPGMKSAIGILVFYWDHLFFIDLTSYHHAIRRQSFCEGFLYYLFLRSLSTALFFLCETRRGLCLDRTGPEQVHRMFQCVIGCVCSQHTLYRFCSVWISYRQFYNITVQATSHAFNMFDSLTPFDCLFFCWFTPWTMLLFWPPVHFTLSYWFTPMAHLTTLFLWL